VVELAVDDVDVGVEYERVAVQIGSAAGELGRGRAQEGPPEHG
jgi:hypothetical protein